MKMQSKQTESCDLWECRGSSPVTSLIKSQTVFKESSTLPPSLPHPSNQRLQDRHEGSNKRRAALQVSPPLCRVLSLCFILVKKPEWFQKATSTHSTGVLSSWFMVFIQVFLQSSTDYGKAVKQGKSLFHETKVIFFTWGKSTWHMPVIFWIIIS